MSEPDTWHTDWSRRLQPVPRNHIVQSNSARCHRAQFGLAQALTRRLRYAKNHPKDQTNSQDPLDRPRSFRNDLRKSVKDSVAKASAAADLDPDRICFTKALRLIRRTATGTANIPPAHWAEQVPKRLADIADLSIPTAENEPAPAP